MSRYNPLLMWGSYAGASLFIVYGIFASFFNLYDFRDILIRMGFGLSSFTHGQITNFSLLIISGFLFGYGIHSLVRAIRR